MNILFLIGVYPNFGGTEKITTILANRFTADGNKVWIASFEQPRPELASELDEGVTLVKLSMPVKSDNNERILKSIIADNSIDVILNQWCLPYFVTQLCNKARKGTKCRLISVLHGVPDRSKKVIVAEDNVKFSTGVIRYWNKAKLFAINQTIKFSLRYVYRNSDNYVLLSESFIPAFEEYASIKADRKKLLSIGNPVTINVSPCSFDDKRKEILYVGRIDKENKRVNRIVEAWQRLFSQYQDWSLVLVGDGPHRTELEEYVKTNNIERVSFEGFVKEDPVEYYKRASILMLTSDLEGFGLVVVDAMSYGVVPIVYGSYSAAYDIIDNGCSGFVTKFPYSQDETVDKMKRLMDNVELRRTMSNQAIDKSKTFSLESVYSKWKTLLDM